MKNALLLLLLGMMINSWSWGQSGSFQAGTSISSGWISLQLRDAQSWGMQAGFFGNYRFSNHFAVESGLNLYRLPNSYGSSNGPKSIQDAPLMGNMGTEQDNLSYLMEIPMLLRICAIQNKKSLWEVNIDTGYSMMYRMGHKERGPYQTAITHNLILGLAIQRMVSGPFFAGLSMRSTTMDISNSSHGGKHLWSIGLRGGIKLNYKR